MTDLAILVPSRGRPSSVARLIEACEKTCRTSYLLHFAFDEDDASLNDNLKAAAGHHVRLGLRHGLADWTNALAGLHMDAAYLASIGDDHLPVTDGWDEQLITVIEHMGGGFAYPNDQVRADIPEAVVISTPVVKALGWMCQPDLSHWYVDNVWADLGRGAGCLAYCPDVIVKHLNPVTGGTWAARGDLDLAPIDATYTDAAQTWDRDLAAYQRWRLHHMKDDIATVRTCLNPR